ncbi:MAG TPA: type II toxin-antitoxin system death-on-curing family toxin [Ardenticatenaceae bacterium]|jgi:death-on-curing protein
MRYLTLLEVILLHEEIIARSGGSPGVRDIGLLEGALGQPRMTFGGIELYPSLVEKAAALGFSLIQNHPFIDGNKRAGHAAMEACLILNGFEIEATVDEQEATVLQVASSEMSRAQLTDWLQRHVIERSNI